jgi:adenylate cyclase
MPRIQFEGDTEWREEGRERTLLQDALDHGIPLAHACGGRARCSTCRVRVLEGAAELAPRGEAESRLAEAKGLPDDVRLACQVQVRNDIRVRRLVHDDLDRALVEAQAKEAGREIQLAILFSDLRNFTPFVERHLPYDVMHMLNRHFQVAGQAILDRGGYIDKYIGDAVMALFGLGDEGSAEEACRHAVEAARAMVRGLRELNPSFEANFDETFACGVGIHFGTAIVGELGHVDRRQITAIGDAVNVAARIESMTKDADASILVSESVQIRVPDLVSDSSSLERSLKGKSGAFRLFRVDP